MGKWWLFYLPLLFIPSFGFGIKTPFGTLELIDGLVLPFLMLLFFAPKSADSGLRAEIKKIGLFFLAWSAATVLWIYLRYDYPKPIPVMLFSVLKLAKFTLYATVGLAISRRLISDDIRNRFHLSLLGVGVVMGVSLALFKSDAIALFVGDLEMVYKGNIVSASMAILFTYIFVLFLKGYGTPLWRKLVIPSLLIMSIGFANTNGRGGWLAAFVGLAYSYFFFKKQVRTILIAVYAGISIIGLYMAVPAFHDQVNKTFFPDERYLQRNEKIGVAGIDDGGRVTSWLNEFSKFKNSPVFGTGFFHRGVVAGIWQDGSHNFWIQMFLETGLVGGLLILIIFFRMWKHSRFMINFDDRISIATRAGLVTAFMVGLSGEYFYGSYGLLTLLLIYASVGAAAPVVEIPETTKTASS